MSNDDETEKYRQLASILLEAVKFYAERETYRACAVVVDHPCGPFADDFDQKHGHDHYQREMPGKMARAAIAYAEREFGDLSIYEVDWKEDVLELDLVDDEEEPVAAEDEPEEEIKAPPVSTSEALDADSSNP